MNPKSLGIYETTTNTFALLPGRTRLVSLAPIGIGTPLVESFTSYLTRLADAHAIPTRNLLSEELMPGLVKGYFFKETRIKPSAWSRNSRAFNGIRSWAQNGVHEVTKLTGRTDLQALTMLPWSTVVPTRGLLRKTKAWCPVCYKTWSRNNAHLYDPLIWALEVIRVCGVHHILLEKNCPNCKREIPFLDSRSYPGHCSHCGFMLHDDTRKPALPDPERSSELQWQLWMIEHIGQLLTAAPRLRTPPDRTCISMLYRQYTESVYHGNISKMARLLQVSWRTTRAWIMGNRLPKLEHLLRSCYCFSISPIDVFSGRIMKPNPSSIRTPLWVGEKVKKRPRRIFDLERIRSDLEKVISAQYLLPPSMADVSRSLEINQSHLLRLFPKLCKAISYRYRIYLKNSKEKRLNRICTHVREITQSLHEDGQYPAYDNICSKLSHPWHLSIPHVKETWKDTLIDLGYIEYDIKNQDSNRNS